MKKLKYNNTDTCQHVLNSHTYNDLVHISDDPEEYNREEMLAAIKSAVESLKHFEVEYLEPLLDELDEIRSRHFDELEYE